jgi:hypothetical protein
MPNSIAYDEEKSPLERMPTERQRWFSMLLATPPLTRKSRETALVEMSISPAPGVENLNAAASSP